MSQAKTKLTKTPRRQFLQTAASTAGAALLAPTIIPSSALGRDGAVAPSERIIMGGIGIGRRGGYDLSCFLPQKDVQFVAVCDVKEKRRGEVKKIIDDHYGNQNCETYRDFRELLDRSDIDGVLIATGPNWLGVAHYVRHGRDMFNRNPAAARAEGTFGGRAQPQRICERPLAWGHQRASLRR